MLQANEHYIVCVNNEYLVACPYAGSVFTRFSNSPYDAYAFDDFIIAQRYASLFNGTVMIHNRITGDLTGGWQ